MGFFRKYPKFHRSIPLSVHHSVWKVSKYGVFSGPYCPNLSGLSGLRITPYSARIRESVDQKKFRICTHFTQCQKEHTISPWKAYKLEKPGVLRMMTIKHRYFDLEIFSKVQTSENTKASSFCGFVYSTITAAVAMKKMVLLLNLFDFEVIPKVIY